MNKTVGEKECGEERNEGRDCYSQSDSGRGRGRNIRVRSDSERIQKRQREEELYSNVKKAVKTIHISFLTVWP